jgi:competence protein ComEA
MAGRYWSVAVGFLILALVASVWYGRTPAEPAPLMVAGTSAVPSSTITIHVSGEVVAPGLVQLPDSARVADAIAAAGGSTRAADLSSVNLASVLRDGDQVVIPGVGDAVTPSAGSDADGQIRINRATVAELEELPGVGPVLAERIAAYRDEHGPFAAVEDLLDVPGIGEGKLATLRESVALP